MLHRCWMTAIIVAMGCKSSSPHAGNDGGEPSPDAGEVNPDAANPDAPPDAGNVCNRVGFSLVPWLAVQGQWTIVADVNHDGLPDVLVGTFATVNVQLGTGGGRFRTKVEYSIRSGSGAAVADVNRDGKLDLIVASTVSVLLGNGDGTFQPAVAVPTAPAAASMVAAADVSGDGVVDLVVPRPPDQVSVLLGRPDGTFGAAVDYATVEFLGTVAIADINSDGKPDLVVTNASSVAVLLGNGDGTFQPSMSNRLLIPVGGISIADVNGDGKLDVVAVRDQGAAEVLNWSELFGNGDGTFQTRIDLEGIPNATAVAVADIDGDGRPDVLAASNLHREVYVLSRGFTPIHVGDSPLSIVVADVSGDGKPDLVVPNRDGANVSVELGNGNGTFRDVPPATGPSSFFFLADLDHDGQLDAVGPGTGANVQVQRGVGDGTFQAPVPYPVDVPIAFAVPADVNHDGKPDIVMLNNKTSQPAGTNLSVLIGNGDASFQPRIDQATDPGVLAFAAADLNGDGNADVIEGYSSGGNDFLRVQLGNGDGTFQDGADYPTAGSPSQVVAADLNGDGQPDLAVISGFDTIGVLLGKPDGTLLPRLDIAVGTSFLSPLAVADVNGDGKPDLIAFQSNSEGRAIRVMLGAGDGTFTLKGEYPASGRADAMAVADVTGDGKPDVLVYSSQASALSVLPGGGDGALEPRIDYGGLTVPSAAMAVGDVTSDGKTDVLISAGSVFVATCVP